MLGSSQEKAQQQMNTCTQLLLLTEKSSAIAYTLIRVCSMMKISQNKVQQKKKSLKSSWKTVCPGQLQ